MTFGQEPTDSPLPSGLDGVDLEPAGEPSAFCGILTPDEVSTALGVTLTVGTSSETDCSWDSDYQTVGLSLIGSRDVLDLDLDIEEVFTDGHALQVDGHDAWYTPDGLALFVDVGDGLVFTLELFGDPAEGLDYEAALSGLATLALPRLASVPVPPEPTDGPEPSIAVDTVLQGLMPQSVGGTPIVVVDAYAGGDLVADTDPDDPELTAIIDGLRSALGAQGKTVDDLSIAVAFYATDTSSGTLTAVRVAGGDAAGAQDALLALLLPMLDPQRAPGTIGGKQVTVVTDGPPVTGSPDPSADPFELPSPPAYVYPSGEVLWIVSADEPELTELFAELP
jgi:hypothetical protein